MSIGDASKKSQNVRLNFNHPVKYLAWVVAHKNKHGMFNAWKQGEPADQFAPIYSAKLLLNGHDRFSERKGSYFSQVQPFQHWQTRPASGVYAYSFALRPADQTLPSGSCNFSRIDNATLQLTFKQASVAANVTSGVRGNVTSEDVTLTMTDANKLENLKIYAINYNVLRILSGMGGLAYILLRRKGAGADSWIKRICGNSFSNRSTLQPLVGTSCRPRDTSKLRGIPESFAYQGMMSERPSWQRMELWYGNNREDWTIRSEAPKGLFCPMENVQRLYGRVGPNMQFGLKRKSRPSHQILRKEGYASTAISFQISIYTYRYIDV